MNVVRRMSSPVFSVVFGAMILSLAACENTQEKQQDAAEERDNIVKLWETVSQDIADVDKFIKDAGHLSSGDVVKRFTEPYQKSANTTITDAKKFKLLQKDQVQIGTTRLKMNLNGENVGDKILTELGIRVDLRRLDSPVKDQGRRGTCTAFAMVSAMENQLKTMTHKTYDLSEDHLWSLYHYPDMPELYEGSQKEFLVEESLWPYVSSYDNDNWEAVPPRPVTLEQMAGKGIAKVSSLKDTKIELLSEMVTVLLEKTPLVLAIDVNESFFTNDRGVLSETPDDIYGGHALEVIGVSLNPLVKGGGYFTVKNSWSPDWGDKGYGYIPFAYCEKFYCAATKIKQLELAPN